MIPPRLRVVFLGTPQFAVPALRALLRAADVLAVITQPDRPRGRGRQLAAPPVARLAQEAGVRLLQPPHLRSADVLATLRELAPELLVTAAYGKIIPQDALTLPPLGCINVHPSLLPRYRGASPIQAAILHGEEETGVTIMYQSAALDAGDIILQRRVPIAPDDTARTLLATLAEVGAEALIDALHLIAEGRAPRIPQDAAQASYAAKLEKAHGRIDWSRPAGELVRVIRAMDPWPSAYTWHRGLRLKIWQARAVVGEGEAGVVLDVRPGEGVVVGTGAGGLLVLDLQPEGRRRMTADEYARGARLQPGERIGERP